MVDKLLGIIDKKDNIIREQAEDIGHLRSELEQLKKPIWRRSTKPTAVSSIGFCTGNANRPARKMYHSPYGCTLQMSRCIPVACRCSGAR